MTEDDTQEIGYLEDGVFWLTASSSIPNAAAAARHLGEEWRAVGEVWLGPTGEWVNHKDPEWAECEPDDPGARPGWRLVDVSTPEIFVRDEWCSNPYFVPSRSSDGGA